MPVDMPVVSGVNKVASWSVGEDNRFNIKVVILDLEDGITLSCYPNEPLTGLYCLQLVKQNQLDTNSIVVNVDDANKNVDLYANDEVVDAIIKQLKV